MQELQDMHRNRQNEHTRIQADKMLQLAILNPLQTKRTQRAKLLKNGQSSYKWTITSKRSTHRVKQCRNNRKQIQESVHEIRQTDKTVG